MRRSLPSPILTAMLALPLLSSCVAQRAPMAPVPPPPARVQTTPPPAAPTVPITDRYAGDWSAADLSPGEWFFRREGSASVALFAVGSGPALAMLRCDDGTITLIRSSAHAPGAAARINIRSSFAERALTAEHHTAPAPQLRTALDARDPLFDQIIYSRGRFVIEASGQPPLIVPTRLELARVIEDCRG